MTWKVPYSDSRITLTRVGDICFSGGNVKFNQNGENNYTQARETIPVGYRPAETSNVPIAVFGGNTTFILYASIRAVWSCSAIRTARTRDAPAYGGPPTRCPPHSFGTLAQAVALSCSDPTGHSAYETVMPNAFRALRAALIGVGHGSVRVYVDDLLIRAVASAVGEVQVHRGTPAFRQGSEIAGVPRAGRRRLPVDAQRDERAATIAFDGTVSGVNQRQHVGLG